MSLSISEVKIRAYFPNEQLRAICSITLNNAIAVHDLKIIQGKDRLFVAMPSRKDSSGIYRDIIHPLHEKERYEFESTIIDAFTRYAESIDSAEIFSN